MNYHDDWPIDFEDYEKRIEKEQPRNPAEATRMRAAVNRLKAGEAVTDHK